MKWQDQYRRVRRWFDEIDAYDRTLGELEDSKRDKYQDLLWAFFQNCWHLKDWIKNDPAVRASHPDIKTTIKSLVESDEATGVEYLHVCSDLATRSKHAEITWNDPRKDALMTNTTFSLNVGSSKTDTWDCLVSFDDGTRREDALAVAEKALAEWDTILQNLGISA